MCDSNMSGCKYYSVCLKDSESGNEICLITTSTWNLFCATFREWMFVSAKQCYRLSQKTLYRESGIVLRLWDWCKCYLSCLFVCLFVFVCLFFLGFCFVCLFVCVVLFCVLFCFGIFCFVLFFLFFVCFGFVCLFVFFFFFLLFKLLYTFSFLKNIRLWKCAIPDWSYSMFCTIDQIAMFLKHKITNRLVLNVTVCVLFQLHLKDNYYPLCVCDVSLATPG